MWVKRFEFRLTAAEVPCLKPHPISGFGLLARLGLKQNGITLQFFTKNEFKLGNL